MKKLLAATAALGLALGAAPAMAQDNMDGDMMMEMSTDQEAMYDGWPADRQAMYDAWPENAQTYFWTLDPMQMDGWWLLNDEQRTRIVAMNPQQKMAAWQSINAQVNGASAAATTPTSNSTMPAQSNAMPSQSNAMPAQTTNAMSNNVRFVSNEMVQRAPAARQGDYPICADGQTDNCINPWEAGKRGRGVARPLDYWPGKPASEM